MFITMSLYHYKTYFIYYITISIINHIYLSTDCTIQRSGLPGDLPSISQLYLASNKLTALPARFGNLSTVQKRLGRWGWHMGSLWDAWSIWNIVGKSAISGDKNREYLCWCLYCYLYLGSCWRHPFSSGISRRYRKSIQSLWLGRIGLGGWGIYISKKAWGVRWSYELSLPST